MSKKKPSLIKRLLLWGNSVMGFGGKGMRYPGDFTYTTYKDGYDTLKASKAKFETAVEVYKSGLKTEVASDVAKHNFSVSAITSTLWVAGMFALAFFVKDASGGYWLLSRFAVCSIGVFAMISLYETYKWNKAVEVGYV